jgi:acetolactate synthase I/II/III large subunit
MTLYQSECLLINDYPTRSKGSAVNGAETILHAAVDAGITTCFANPGTTEMPLVAAMDATPKLHSVLCLFEGVCTGAADGYARIAGGPALTVLHLGPGLANGIANLHNARRAYTPVLNVVGEHVTWHRDADPPLNSDIDALAATVCGRVARLEKPADLVDQFGDLVVFTRQPLCGPTTAIVPHDVQLADIPDGPTTARPVTAAGHNLCADLLDEAAVAVRTGTFWAAKRLPRRALRRRAGSCQRPVLQRLLADSPPG